MNEKKTLLHNKVSSEEPALDDSLNLSTYVKGLSEFIKECSPPMTISIQGDWGAGKTTLFNLICKELNNGTVYDWDSVEDFVKADQPVIKINTWQFAVAGYKDKLTLVLIALIYKKIEEAVNLVNHEDLLTEKEMKEFKINGNKIAKFIGSTFVFGTEFIFGENSASIVKGIADSIGHQNKTEQQKNDLLLGVTYVQEMRDAMQEGINTLCKILKKDKIIIFIDDLDRLEPKNAVELLEGVKNFIDCEKCLFVLAIDQNVVFQGVKEKYGERMGEKLGNKFFDKIIQVPFTLPVVSYELDKYIKELRPAEKDNVELIKQYNIVVSRLTDKNPRGLKRLFSIFFLYEKFEKLDEKDPRQKVILLAILAFQMKYGKALDNLIKEVEKVDKEDIKPEDIEHIKEKLNSQMDNNEEETEKVYSELGKVLRALYLDVKEDDGEDTGSIDDEVYVILLKLLKGTIGAANKESRNDLNASDKVKENLVKFSNLLLSEEGVGEEKVDLEKIFRLYYYKDSPDNKFVMLSVYDDHFNINMYEAMLPDIYKRIEDSNEFEGIKKSSEATDKNKLCYFKRESGKSGSSVGIANIDNEVDFELLQNLYDKYIKGH